MVAPLACVFLVLIFKYFKAGAQKERFITGDGSYPVDLVVDHAGLVLRVLLDEEEAGLPFGFLLAFPGFLVYDFLDPT